MIEAQITEFFYFLSILILFVYAILEKYRWKEGIHSKHIKKRRMNSYKQQELPRNQFVIDEQGDQEEQQHCKSEEDLPPQLDTPPPSIAQTQKPRIFHFINYHMLYASIIIYLILNDICNIPALVLFLLFLFSNLIVVFCNLTKPIYILLPHLFIIAIFINYLVTI